MGVLEKEAQIERQAQRALLEKLVRYGVRNGFPVQVQHPAPALALDQTPRMSVAAGVLIVPLVAHLSAEIATEDECQGWAQEEIRIAQVEASMGGSGSSN